jgi:hypothetical protein
MTQKQTQEVIDFFKCMGIPIPICEFQFHPERQWRFDFAWPEAKLAVEVDGGLFTGGRHARADGILKDYEKRQHATILGWRIMPTIPRDIISLGFAEKIRKAL